MHIFPLGYIYMFNYRKVSVRCCLLTNFGIILFTSIRDTGEKGGRCDFGFQGRESYYLIVIILSHCFIVIIL